MTAPQSRQPSCAKQKYPKIKGGARTISATTVPTFKSNFFLPCVRVLHFLLRRSFSFSFSGDFFVCFFPLLSRFLYFLSSSSSPHTCGQRRGVRLLAKMVVIVSGVEKWGFVLGRFLRGNFVQK